MRKEYTFNVESYSFPHHTVPVTVHGESYDEAQTIAITEGTKILEELGEETEDEEIIAEFVDVTVIVDGDQ